MRNRRTRQVTKNKQRGRDRSQFHNESDSFRARTATNSCRHTISLTFKSFSRWRLLTPPDNDSTTIDIVGSGPEEISKGGDHEDWLLRCCCLENGEDHLPTANMTNPPQHVRTKSTPPLPRKLLEGCFVHRLLLYRYQRLQPAPK